jgi:hypothetical protein
MAITANSQIDVLAAVVGSHPTFRLALWVRSRHMRSARVSRVCTMSSMHRIRSKPTALTGSRAGKWVSRLPGAGARCIQPRNYAREIRWSVRTMITKIASQSAIVSMVLLGACANASGEQKIREMPASLMSAFFLRPPLELPANCAMTTASDPSRC